MIQFSKDLAQDSLTSNASSIKLERERYFNFIQVAYRKNIQTRPFNRNQEQAMPWAKKPVVSAV